MADYYDFNDDVILPDDFDPAAIDNAGVNTEEPAAPTTEPALEDGSVETQTEATIPQEPEVPKAQTIKVKFNHEERELGLDEAAMYAQKGMNYDKLDERVKGYEANMAKSNRLAKQLGYANADEMIAAAEQNYINRQIRELMDEGNTEAMARFLVEQEMAKAAPPEVTPEPAPQETPKPEEAEGMSSERKAELDEFVKAYPGVVNLPDEVIAANQNGVRLKTAYDNYQLKQKYEESQKQLNILKQNQAAAEHAPVTGVIGKAAPKATEPDDPFLKGFDYDY